MADAASAHLDQWVGWLLEAQQVESRQRGAMNGRDDKLREFAFKAAMSDCIEYVGPDKCVDLAAAWTGPIAEAYVGGGS
jgi:hypothetical protein